MELIFKMPDKKPPFIGIVFADAQEACTLNEDLVNRRSHEKFQITMHFMSGQVKLILENDNPSDFRTYKNLQVNERTMRNFMYMNRKCEDFRFAHILRDFDREVIVTTWEMNKTWKLKIAHVYLMVSN